MNIQLFEKLSGEGLVSPESLQKVKAAEGKKLFSLHWELKTILYLGVLLLSGGLGILIYKNIDTIGHQAILFAIAALAWDVFITRNGIKHISPGTRCFRLTVFLITLYYWAVCCL